MEITRWGIRCFYGDHVNGDYVSGDKMFSWAQCDCMMFIWRKVDLCVKGFFWTDMRHLLFFYYLCNQ